VATGFAVGNKVSIADFHLYDLIHLHLRPSCVPEEMKAFPNLLRLHDNVAVVPAIKAFIESERRPEQVNGNKLG
jgi:hypothetical protein